MNLILKYKPYGISVTDLSTQLWCEKQLEFSLERGRVKTQEMQKGGDRHQDLHKEIAILVKVEPKSIEDFVALKLHNCLVGLTRLLREGITREIPVFGKVNSLFVVGSVDEFVLEKNKLKIVDTKTRKSNNMPSETQKRTTKFQLMLYKHLFDSIKEERFSINDLLKYYNFNEGSYITKEFQKQINDIGDKIEPNLLKLMTMVFSLIKRFPKIDDIFEVRYEHQGSKMLIGVDRFGFDSFEFKRNCDFVEEFWLGKRKAMLVEESNSWKCNICEFNQECKSDDGKLNKFMNK